VDALVATTVGSTSASCTAFDLGAAFVRAALVLRFVVAPATFSADATLLRGFGFGFSSPSFGVLAARFRLPVAFPSCALDMDPLRSSAFSEASSEVITVVAAALSRCVPSSSEITSSADLGCFFDLGFRELAGLAFSGRSIVLVLLLAVDFLCTDGEASLSSSVGP